MVASALPSSASAALSFSLGLRPTVTERSCSTVCASGKASKMTGAWPAPGLEPQAEVGLADRRAARRPQREGQVQQVVAAAADGRLPVLAEQLAVRPLAGLADAGHRQIVFAEALDLARGLQGSFPEDPGHFGRYGDVHGCLRGSGDWRRMQAATVYVILGCRKIRVGGGTPNAAVRQWACFSSGARASGAEQRSSPRCAVAGCGLSHARCACFDYARQRAAGLRSACSASSCPQRVTHPRTRDRPGLDKSPAVV